MIKNLIIFLAISIFLIANYLYFLVKLLNMYEKSNNEN